MTACWSKSHTGTMHPYYLCETKGFSSCRKSIKRDELEGSFEELLQSMEPSDTLYQLAKAMFRDAWDMQLAKQQRHRRRSRPR
jgi:hypothetical protein